VSADAPDPAQRERGRRIALAVAGVLGALDAAVTIGYVSRFQPLPSLVMRLAVTCILALLLVRGFSPVRWVLAAFLLSAILFGQWDFPDTRAELARGWPGVLVYAAYGLITWILLFSRPLAAFMRHPRDPAHSSAGAP
jgi:hypothetical protein